MYGIDSLLHKAARFFPDRNAVIDIHGKLTYSELNDKVSRIANGLLALGYKKGDRMGFICDNCNEFAEMWLATQRAGLVAVFLNYRLTQAELSRDVRRAACNALFYAPKWKNTILAGDTSDTQIRHIFSFGHDIPDNHICLEKLALKSPNTPMDANIKESDWSTILYTSGSTGMSKGVVRTHRMIFDYAMQMAAENEYYKTEEIRLLSHSPLFHTGGLSMLMKTLVLCGTYIGINGIDPKLIGALIEEYRINQLFFVPPVNIMRLYHDEEIRSRDLSSVKHIWATGGKLSLQYVDAMLELFPNARIKTSYGGTEFCAACSMSLELERSRLEEDPGIFDSAGYIGQLVDVRIVDDDGNDVARGEAGELWVSSSFVMEGYLDDPEETAAVMSGGWYKTGDVFRVDERGLFFFLDRKSAMIKPGGENVYPSEVESVLRTHPQLTDCAVIGLPDAKWGEAVAAALVPETEDFNILSVIDFAKEHLAGFRKPMYYTVLSELPLTASGKIDRRALLDKSKYTFESVEQLKSKGE